MSTVSPFAQGEAAHKEGQKAIANPYTFHSDNWLGWDSGWRIAQRKAQKEADKAQREAIEARPLDSWVTQEATK
jgi:hypothetical protein